MANNSGSVDIPVKLEVVDISMEQVDLKDIGQKLNQKVSGIAKSIETILSNTDTSKFNKALESSFNALEKSYDKVQMAQAKYNEALAKAGESSEAYKSKLSEVKSEMKAVQDEWNTYNDFLGPSYSEAKKAQASGNLKPHQQSVIKMYEEELAKYEQKMSLVREKMPNPMEFVSSGSESAITKVTQSYKDLLKAMQATNKAQEQWNTTSQANKMSDEYSKKIQELNVLEKKLLSVKEKSDKMAATGASTKSWKNLHYDASLLEQKISKIITELQGMVKSGQAFRFGTGDADKEMDALSSRFENLKNSMSSITKNSLNVKGNILGLIKSVDKFSKSATKGISNVISMFKKLHKTSAHTSKNMGKSLKKLWRDILMFGLGVRSTFFLIRRLRNIFIESFQEMSKQIPEINTQISSFMTSVNQLKGSLGTAFQPLVSFVIPAINQLTASLNNAMVALGKFFATLTGQGYIYKFTAAQVDYAESLKGTSGAAKDAQKSLMGFDEINRLNGDNDGGAGSGDVPTGKWETEMLDGMSSLAELIKKAWSESDFTEVGRYIGDKLLEALTTANDWITSKGFAYAEKIGKSVATLINGVFDTLGLGDALGKTIANSLNIALIAIDTFLATTDWSDIGTFLYESLNSAIQNFDWNLLGKSVADLLMAAINMWHTFVGGFDFTALGTSLSTAINTMLSKLGEVDDSGLSGWSKLGQSISNSLQGIIESITTALNGISWDEVGTAIGELIGSIDWGSITWDFTVLVASVVSALGEAFLNWAETEPISAGIVGMLVTAFAGIKLAPIIAGLVSFGSKIAEVIALTAGGAGTLGESISAVFGAGAGPFAGIISVISGVVMAFTNFFSMLKNGFSWLKEILMIIGIALTTLGVIILAPIEGVGIAIAAIVGAIVAVVMTVVVLVKQYWTEICDFFKSAWQAICDFFVSAWEWLKNAFSTALEFIKDLWTTVWTAVRDFFVNLWNGIVDFVTNAINTIKDVITNVINAISDWWTNTWTFIKNTATNIWNGIKNTITTIFNTIKNGIVTVINGIKTVWTNGWNAIKNVVTNVWNGIWGFIKSIINSIIGGINGMIRGIVSGINAVVDVLNKLSFKVPDWVPGLGGSKFGFNLSHVNAPQIPKLAQGGVIPPNKEFMAILGDQKHGTNIEAPLDTIKQAVAEELAEYIDAMMTGFQAVVDAVNEKDFDVKIGDNAIGKAAERYNKRQALVRGTS